jgi:hypothetical protein
MHRMNMRITTNRRRGVSPLRDGYWPTCYKELPSGMSSLPATGPVRAVPACQRKFAPPELTVLRYTRTMTDPAGITCRYPPAN